MESGCDIDNVLEMIDVIVRTASNGCTLVIDMTINNYWAEAMVDSGVHVSILSRILYDSLSCIPRPV